jgi:hypothetical protein
MIGPVRSPLLWQIAPKMKLGSRSAIGKGLSGLLPRELE